MRKLNDNLDNLTYAEMCEDFTRDYANLSDDLSYYVEQLVINPLDTENLSRYYRVVGILAARAAEFAAYSQLNQPIERTLPMNTNQAYHKITIEGVKSATKDTSNLGIIGQEHICSLPNDFSLEQYKERGYIVTNEVQYFERIERNKGKYVPQRYVVIASKARENARIVTIEMIVVKVSY